MTLSDLSCTTNARRWIHGNSSWGSTESSQSEALTLAPGSATMLGHTPRLGMVYIRGGLLSVRCRLAKPRTIMLSISRKERAFSARTAVIPAKSRVIGGSASTPEPVTILLPNTPSLQKTCRTCSSGQDEKTSLAVSRTRCPGHKYTGPSPIQSFLSSVKKAPLWYWLAFAEPCSSHQRFFQQSLKLNRQFYPTGCVLTHLSRNKRLTSKRIFRSSNNFRLL